MKLENLRSKKLTFKDTFLYLKKVLLGNYLNFSKLFLLWCIFSFLLCGVISFVSDYLDAFFIIIGYIVFYLFYLVFILQTRALIDKTQVGIWASFKDVFEGFVTRKGYDLLELIPITLIVFLTAFFPSSIFAIPLAFIIALSTIIYIVWTIFAQPVVVIKKIPMFAAIRYSTNLISGYFTFVLGLMITLAFACLVLYVPFIFIKTSSFMHQVLMCSCLGVEIMLFAIMLTIVYTNLEIAWSIGFKNYDDSLINDNLEETNHEFTEFFNRVPEVQIKEDNKESKKENKNLKNK